jgi:hypothetical protein
VVGIIAYGIAGRRETGNDPAALADLQSISLRPLCALCVSAVKAKLPWMAPESRRIKEIL